VKGLAFAHNNIEEIIEKALTFIPEGSEYARVVKAVKAFYKEHPDNWRAAREYLESDFGYDKYPGVCHMIPNAGVCALALYYAQGDFARTVEIATMCGWDTDCNAGNVGAIIGVMNGPECIPEHYLRPLNDFHAASSISGALNIIDLPTASKELAVLGLKQQGEIVPDAWKPGVFSDDIHLDFSLPNSTCGIRTSSDFLAPIAPGEELKEKGKLSILLDRMVRGNTARIFYKPYYRRDDFDDERYSPTFTPLAYPGQLMKIQGSVERISGQKIAVAPYVRDAESKEVISGGYMFPIVGETFSIDWKLPEVDFAIDETSLLVTNFDKDKYLGHLYLPDFSITGKRKFSVKFGEEQHEFGGLTRCSVVGGAWEIEDNGLRVIAMDDFHLYSGSYYTKDSTAECVVVPEYGDSHLLVVRSRGAESGYYFGLHGKGKAALLKRNHSLSILKEIDFSWELEKSVILEVTASGNNLTGKIDGVEVLTYTDKDALPYGMAGIAKLSQGRSLFMSLRAEEVCLICTDFSGQIPASGV